MNYLFVIIAMVVLDLLLGDPADMPHPVKLFGRMITEGEAWLRDRFPADPSGEKRGGLILVTAVSLITFFVSYLAIAIAARIFLPLAYGLQILWGWQAIAISDMMKESKNVHKALTENGEELFAARNAVSRIVGRDTKELSKAGIIRATVETVAESFNDGFFAPLFYFAIGGAPLALTYKAINTMDSMIGYKNEEYINFGRAAARMDDIANFLPSRMAALIMIPAAKLLGFDEKNAYRIWQRDRKKSTSPNSGQTESVMAGALHIRLLGPASYFGKVVDKPYIGDDDREVEPYDILRANKMYEAASFLGVGVMVILAFILH